MCMPLGEFIAVLRGMLGEDNCHEYTGMGFRNQLVNGKFWDDNYRTPTTSVRFKIEFTMMQWNIVCTLSMS